MDKTRARGSRHVEKNNSYYSHYDMGKPYFQDSRSLLQEVRDIFKEIKQIRERTLDGFNESVWEDYNQRCAIYAAEKAMLKTTNNTTVVANCTTVVELACANVIEEKPTIGENCSSIIAQNSTCGTFCVEHDEEVVECSDKPDTFVDIQTDMDDKIEEIHKESNMPLVEFTDVSLQDHQKPPLESHSGLLTTPNTAPILHTHVVAHVGLEGKPSDIQASHIYYDPFLVHLHPLDYIVTDFYGLKIMMFGKMMAALCIFFLVWVDGFYIGIIRRVGPTFIFDPGGFEDESFRRRGE